MTTLVKTGSSSVDAIRHIGNIPVRNLWLLMLYASELYQYIGSRRIDIEKNPDKIADLVAEILCNLVEHRLKRNLSYGYESKVAVVSRVRGRINALITESHRLLDKGKVCCKYDELTVDTPRNRYVRAALEKLIRCNIRTPLARKCRALSIGFERLGVGSEKPSGYSGKSERFGYCDSIDQKMVAAADLAFSLALPTEFRGHFHLTSPDTKKEWLRKLFEKAIAGFYRIVLDNRKYSVSSGKRIDWQISGKTAGIDEILPSMKTDIVIDRKELELRLVIDTKFNSITKKAQYREKTLSSSYIYQMYAYLRSQENEANSSSFSSIGMLLHPTVDEEIDETVTIQGHPIRFCTVNLGEEATDIRERLLSLIETSFGQWGNGCISTHEGEIKIMRTHSSK